MSTRRTEPARGMRDFLSDDVRRRQHVIGIVSQVYERYGFEPIETPAVENLETLLGKYGDEGNQLIFKILKRGEHEASGEADLALRRAPWRHCSRRRGCRRATRARHDWQVGDWRYRAPQQRAAPQRPPEQARPATLRRRPFDTNTAELSHPLIETRTRRVRRPMNPTCRVAPARWPSPNDDRQR